MDISCENCRSKFRIPDEKMANGKPAAFVCPKCKNRITVKPPDKTEGRKLEDLKKEIVFDEVDSETDLTESDSFDKPFNFIEEEGKTALLCEEDPEKRQKIIDTLKLMEYNITAAKTDRDAIKRMRYHRYDLILVNEDFGTTNPDLNKVLIYLERQTMDIRRNIFVGMISRRFRTMDQMMALHKSVNIIINIKNINDIGRILSRGLTENDLFYRLFKEMLKDAGH